MLSGIEEVLEQDSIAPADLECDDVQQLLEQLPEFVKLTVFKKGRVYATIVPNEEYDGILERAKQKPAKSEAANGKPWKRRKGAKDPKIEKPRHRETKDAETANLSVAATDQTGEQDDATRAEATKEEETVTADATASEQGPEDAAPAIESEDTEPEPEVAPEPESSPAVEPASAPEAEPAPSINLTITYNPYDSDDKPASADEATISTGKGAAPAEKEPLPPEPTPTREQATPHSDLPGRFSEEVHCKDELLRLLYQTLPLDVDIMRTLDEDWRVAQSTSTLTGTRSRISFPLRYLHEDGSGPVMLTIRKSSRATAGKHWSLELVDGNDGSGSAHEAVGLEGLPTVDAGAWSDLADPRATERTNPTRELAQFAVMGSWDSVLGTLATMAAPERWNYPGEGVGGPSRYGILREYLTVSFHRARQQGRVAEAADGSLAAINTGLLTPFSEDIYAVFSPNKKDIPWKLDGFCVSGSGDLGARLAGAFAEPPAPASYLTSLEEVFPNSERMLILDTDALLGRQLGRLPRAFLEEQLASNTEASQALSAGMAAGNGRLSRQSCRDLARAIKADPGLFRRMGQALSDACALSLHHVRGSYRLAAPVYEPASNSMRVLLPLCLVEDNRADCAVSLELMPSGAYRATAVLSLPRAYACARVVSAEQPRWLSPDVALA